MDDFQLTKTPLRGKALCVFPNGNLLCCRGGSFRLYEKDTYREMSSFRLPGGRLKSSLCRIRLLERLLHCEPRWAVPMGEKEAVICGSSGIYRVDCETGECRKEPVPVRGKPLSAALIRGIPGFTDGIVMGDYGTNPDRAPVSLYRRSDAGDWQKVYTFPAGSVRHIHGIFPDPETQQVYILTGDEDQESGIYVTKDDFRTAVPLLAGSQQYRACRMIASGESILYMTDAPSEPNFIYRFSGGKVEKVSPLSGTCIYGAAADGMGIFSTTVEPEAHAKNRLAYWLSSKPGRGIRGRRIDVFLLGEDGTPKPVAHFTHDGLPLRLFQYGTVTFSNFHDHTVYFTPHCVRKGAERVFRVDLTEKDLE